ADNPAHAGVQLLRRALVHATRKGALITSAALPTEAWEALASALAEADPWSEIVFQLSCPRCDQGWESLLEPGDYVWHEIAGSAQHTLRQVHRLATAYG